MTNRVGRPEKEMDWRLLDSILQYGASLIDCSELLEMSEDSIQRKIKEESGQTFSEYRESKKSKIRMKLRQKQYEMAMNGNVALLIWLGKNELGQKDKLENDIKIGESSGVHISIIKDEQDL